MHQYAFGSILALGWIPYHRDFYAIQPKNNHHSYIEHAGGLAQLGMDLFFYSGNRLASPLLQTRDEFNRILQSRNYRGALALFDIRLTCMDDGAYRLDYGRMGNRSYFIGYTPYRLLRWRSEPVYWYAKGKGHEIDPFWIGMPDGVRLNYGVEFRIGRVGNLGSRLLTGYWAPDVWMHIDCEFKCDGTGIIHLSGSRIPNQNRFHADAADGPYREVYAHDMEQNSLADVTRVFQGGVGRVQDNYHTSIAIRGRAC